MFTARFFILIMSLGKLAYNMLLTSISDKHRKKPLPEEVADVYEPERYQTYIDFQADKKKLRNKYSLITLITDIILIFSPIYRMIDGWCNQNPYLVFLTTYMIIWVISTIIDTFSSYEITFGLMEKYGLNKKDLKEFIKDEVLNGVFGLVLTVGLLELLTYIGEHMNMWTNNFTVGYKISLLILAGIIAVLLLFVGIAQLISYAVLRKQYTFTPLEDGELKDKINALQEDSKKKVKYIYVYNESKKTTTKNAFLLKLFWHREFGIADNFMNENAEDELLAVLSHEIGHLKHKKNILNFIGYADKVVLAIILLLLMVKPDIILACTEWIRTSFDISANNYYLVFIVFGYVITPIAYLRNMFSMYKSRWEEYEADREATRDISSHLHDVYGVDASAEMISHMTDRILPVAKEWQNRPLERKYAVVFMDAVHFHVREDNRTVKKAVYVAIGVKLNGTKEVLGMWIGGNESAKYWLGVLNEIKNRGVEDIMIVSVDGLTGFVDAIGAVFPKAEVQRCIVHQVRYTTKFVNYKDLKPFVKDLKAIYQAPSEEMALEALLYNHYPQLSVPF